MSKRTKIAVGLYLLVALAAVVVLAVTVVPGGSFGERHHSSTERRYVWVDTQDVAIGGPLTACVNANASAKVLSSYRREDLPRAPFPFKYQDPIELSDVGGKPKTVAAKCEVRNGAHLAGEFKGDRP